MSHTVAVYVAGVASGLLLAAITIAIGYGLAAVSARTSRPISRRTES